MLDVVYNYTVTKAPALAVGRVGNAAYLGVRPRQFGSRALLAYICTAGKDTK